MQKIKFENVACKVAANVSGPQSVFKISCFVKAAQLNFWSGPKILFAFTPSE